ncbi:MAG: putative sulfate exporter family transporter [Gammaproteobacteria bacterium]|nr:putative sulfate exporter family transporter [Gammaproteobacteria bacterium]
MNALTSPLRVLGPGILLCVTIAAAASFLAEHYGAPAMLFALLLGIAFHFLAEEGRSIHGVDFTAKKILRFGVALLGLRVTFTEMASLGWSTVALVCSGVLLTILFGIACARLLGRRIRFGTLTGGSVAICGASAALAIAAILPKNEFSERNLIFTVIAVTGFSTIAMVLYPLVAGYAGLDDRAAGIFLGGTIHDVAQVVGAGYAISPEAGDTATITKLLRVALLVPVVLGLSLYFRSQGGSQAKSLTLPLFVVGFCLCVALNSAGLVPEAVLEGLDALSRWCLLAAIAGLGIKTSLESLFTIGYQPVVMVLSETVFIALWVLIGVQLIG